MGKRLGFIFLLAFLVFIIIYYSIFYFSNTVSIPLQKAENDARTAVQSQEVSVRETYLNKSLTVYQNLEDTYAPLYGNGKFYENVGNVYLQLEDYPAALYYFHQSKALRPRDSELDNQIKSLQEKLLISVKEEDSIFRKVFFFHYGLSLPERLTLLSIGLLTLIILSSVYVWKKLSFLKGTMAFVFLITSLFLGSVLYTKYMEPLEGVLLNPSLLYTYPSNESVLVDQTPLKAGIKLEILGADNQEWLKVRQDEKIGFVLSEKVRAL
jgi:hypothetical protein